MIDKLSPINNITQMNKGSNVMLFQIRKEYVFPKLEKVLIEYLTITSRTEMRVIH
jgi:hypothetical protein